MSTDIATAATEEELVERLSALAACDGSPRLAVRRLAESNVATSIGELAVLREQHQGMYQAIAVERASAQEEAIAIEMREITRLGQRATRVYLEELNRRLDEGDLDYKEKASMAQTIQALAKVMAVGVDKTLALTGRPTDGKSGDPLKAAEELVRLGVLVPRERPQVDAEVPIEDVTEITP